MTDFTQKKIEEFREKFYPQDFANEGDKQYWEEDHNWQEIVAFLADSLTSQEQELRERLEKFVWGVSFYSHSQTARDLEKKEVELIELEKLEEFLASLDQPQTKE